MIALSKKKALSYSEKNDLSLYLYEKFLNDPKEPKMPSYKKYRRAADLSKALIEWETERITYIKREIENNFSDEEEVRRILEKIKQKKKPES
ncbi:MAG: hypothetical protein A2430_00225 [Candidatus Liptonbacteria bacterium RIFOXYC1_FULL_36_8]|uniref:Uncharacterized protein n=3 Tax=Candidatus Liptoniibacteriota TaxID=1817909 RepID=A0A1G2CQR3_9BACT|nr:MAG: hypothetical protein A2390_02160 [Candidatus Liptonbacteria bacterium RIFOXYB1_FULL_36_10]OGZ03035.1 MAG: hypothetical protein A2604_00995 [Candidatus Liptonbacteria bacterium RIFOXYD1_FULL_36_11]OGZ03060.1 MAG: hypothetical protein A2430_00225 [Candidatus Liptonbacteria bacterium RIFOXYC1_FULL_36_8]